MSSPIDDFVAQYPLESRSVDLVLAGLIREATGGQCEPGKICDLCDCFAGRESFAAERGVAEEMLRIGLTKLAQRPVKS